MNDHKNAVAIIGAGPCGLMAAELCANAGLKVTVFDRMPQPARKFLMAGRGGLNLTHSEPLHDFIQRYGTAADFIAPIIKAFPPEALRTWCQGLGIETFVGTSGRIFPKTMKASPLLRAWLARLNERGVRFALRHDWQGWDENGNLLFKTPDGVAQHHADATLLALGGASWPKLGADGSWVNILSMRGITVAPLRPANCGFVVNWSDIIRTKFSGTPLKNLTLTFQDKRVQGEIIINQHGVEGGAIYALSAPLRDAITAHGKATFFVDLRKELDHAGIVQRLNAGRGGASLSTFLKKTLNLSPVAIALLHEASRAESISLSEPEQLAQLIKALPITVTQPFPLQRAISTAGGIMLDEIDNHFMLKKAPGVFVAGEMLDWEAPTGGYLLQACFSMGVATAQGIKQWLAQHELSHAL